MAGKSTSQRRGSTVTHRGAAVTSPSKTLNPATQFSMALIDLSLPFLSPTTSDIVSIDGHELTGSMLQHTSSSNEVTVSTTTAGLDMVQRSEDAFNTVLKSGATIYGANTGFGGSAGARTMNHRLLQVALIQMLNSASYTATEVDSQKQQQAQEAALDRWITDINDNGARDMPIKWVRAAILVRANTLLRGHSGVTKEAVTGLIALLNAKITPVIPMTGSISASGDLTPLSFVVSTLQGSPSTMVWDHSDLSNITMVAADKALRSIRLAPLVCGPKEALALVNGTAFSDAAGCLVVNDALLLAALAQMLTAMAVEAMCGHVESFEPYIAEVKEDDYQSEIAQIIRGFLKESKLARGLDVLSIHHLDKEDVSIKDAVVDNSQELAQDRYALRTSSQWLAPPVQEIVSAFHAVQKGLNSTTDNPIVDGRDPGNPTTLNGGNFQGSRTAFAMDKTRSALQLIGKLMFAQCTEVVNPTMNNGLPANLAATDPSMDFACKGLDINIAAYCSELGWLANPIGPHVQSAEMHNQAVNSLALISARKTGEAVSILQKMMASCLYILCQALDIRVMQMEFFKVARSSFSDLAKTLCFDVKLEEALWTAIRSNWKQSGTFDLVDRVDKAVTTASPVLLAGLVAHARLARSGTSHMNKISTTEQGSTPRVRRRSSNGQKRVSPNISADCVEQWQHAAKHLLINCYTEVRTRHFSNYVKETPKYLSKHTVVMYTFIRKDLNVPMFQGLADSPTRKNGKKSVGGYVGDVEMALRSGKIMKVLSKAIRDVIRLGAVFPDEDTNADAVDDPSRAEVA